jgi:SRSO17 transposase
VGKQAGPGPQQRRFAAYIEGLAKAAGHADRNVPLKNYCTGLLLPGERKSIEPMAARLASEDVQRMHQSLHHLVADAPWSDEAVVDRVLDTVLPAMLGRGPVVCIAPDRVDSSEGVSRSIESRSGSQINLKIATSLKWCSVVQAFDNPVLVVSISKFNESRAKLVDIVEAAYP